MTVLAKEDEARAWHVHEIENDLKALQEFVGGYIEVVPIAKDAAVICNEEGRLRGLPFNTRVNGRAFVGPLLIVGVDGPEFTDVHGVNAEVL